MSEQTEPPEIDIKEWVLAVLERWSETINERIGKQDERIDGLEQQLAVVTSAYAELAVLVQSLIYTKITLKDQEEFDANVAKGKEEMLRTFQDGIRQTQTESKRFYPGSNSASADTGP